MQVIVWLVTGCDKLVVVVVVVATNNESVAKKTRS